MVNFNSSSFGGGGKTDWWGAIAPLAPMVATALLVLSRAETGREKFVWKVTTADRPQRG